MCPGSSPHPPNTCHEKYTHNDATLDINYNYFPICEYKERKKRTKMIIDGNRTTQLSILTDGRSRRDGDRDSLTILRCSRTLSSTPPSSKSTLELSMTSEMIC
jgi:hypothetical protein